MGTSCEDVKWTAILPPHYNSLKKEDLVYTNKSNLLLASPTNNLLFRGSGKQLILYDIQPENSFETGELFKSAKVWPLQQRLINLQISPDEKMLACSGILDDGKSEIKLFDIGRLRYNSRSKDPLNEAGLGSFSTQDDISSMIFSSTNKRLAALNSHGIVIPFEIQRSCGRQALRLIRQSMGEAPSWTAGAIGTNFAYYVNTDGALNVFKVNFSENVRRAKIPKSLNGDNLDGYKVTKLVVTKELQDCDWLLLSLVKPEGPAWLATIMVPHDIHRSCHFYLSSTRVDVNGRFYHLDGGVAVSFEKNTPRLFSSFDDGCFFECPLRLKNINDFTAVTATSYTFMRGSGRTAVFVLTTENNVLSFELSSAKIMQNVLMAIRGTIDFQTHALLEFGNSLIQQGARIDGLSVKVDSKFSRQEAINAEVKTNIQGTDQQVTTLNTQIAHLKLQICEIKRVHASKIEALEQGQKRMWGAIGDLRITSRTQKRDYQETVDAQKKEIDDLRQKLDEFTKKIEELEAENTNRMRLGKPIKFDDSDSADEGHDACFSASLEAVGDGSLQDEFVQDRSVAVESVHDGSVYDRSVQDGAASGQSVVKSKRKAYPARKQNARKLAPYMRSVIDGHKFKTYYRDGSLMVGVVPFGDYGSDDWDPALEELLLDWRSQKFNVSSDELEECDVRELKKAFHKALKSAPGISDVQRDGNYLLVFFD